MAIGGVRNSATATPSLCSRKAIIIIRDISKWSFATSEFVGPVLSNYYIPVPSGQWIYCRRIIRISDRVDRSNGQQFTIHGNQELGELELEATGQQSVRYLQSEIMCNHN